MQDKQPTLLLTRPKQQSFEFLARCEKLAGHRLPVVMSPILRIETHGTWLDLNGFAVLIFTSSNGVAALAEQLRGRKVVTVGEKTCERALKAGADAISLGEDVDAFVVNAGTLEGPVLHCRGTHARGDLVERLRATGLQAEETIVYDQIAQPLSQAAKSLLQSPGRVVVPLFSPRSAKLLSDNTISADLQIVAMSTAVAAAWSGGGKVEIISSPTATEMAKQTIQYF